MYMVFVVLDDPDKLGKVLEAFDKGGVSGATILESTGLHRQKKKRIALRYLYTAPTLEEMDNITLFTIVADKKAVDDCLAMVESVVGDMNNPDTGIFAAWELGVVKGLRTSEETSE